MKMLKKAAEKVKDGLVFLVSIPFVLFSSVVIHVFRTSEGNLSVSYTPLI